MSLKLSIIDYLCPDIIIFIDKLVNKKNFWIISKAIYKLIIPLRNPERLKLAHRLIRMEKEVKHITKPLYYLMPIERRCIFSFLYTNPVKYGTFLSFRSELKYHKKKPELKAFEDDISKICANLRLLESPKPKIMTPFNILMPINREDSEEWINIVDEFIRGDESKDMFAYLPKYRR